MIAAEGRQGVRLGLMSTGAITVGIDVTCVAEVCPVRNVSRLLAAAPGLLGAIDLRGNPTLSSTRCASRGWNRRQASRASA